MRFDDALRCVLFSCALHHLCACTEGCGKEWYIDENGCAVGKVVITSLDDYRQVIDVSCFKGQLRFMDFPPADFSPGLLDNIVEAEDFVINVTDETKLKQSSPDLAGQIALNNALRLEEFSIFTNGVVSVDVPLVVSATQIVISENIDLNRASFGSLVEITGSVTAEKSPALVLNFPALKRIGGTGSIGMNIGDISEVISLPELEQINGYVKISASGVGTLDENGDYQWSGGTVDFPKLSTVNGWIDIGSLNMQKLSLPSLKIHPDRLSLGGYYAEGALDSFGLEEAGAISISSWVTADGTTTLPHLRKADSISMKSFDHAKVLYMPALEELGSLLLEECWKLRKVDFPALKCLGSVETLIYFPNSPFCLLPEELDDEIALSRANGCEPVVDVDDPRTNFYHPYDENWCLADGP